MCENRTMDSPATRKTQRATPPRIFYKAMHTTSLPLRVQLWTQLPPKAPRQRIRYSPPRPFLVPSHLFWAAGFWSYTPETSYRFGQRTHRIQENSFARVSALRGRLAQGSARPAAAVCPFGGKLRVHPQNKRWNMKGNLWVG